MRRPSGSRAWLAIEPVHHIVSSPKRRAVETATPLATAVGLGIEIIDGLVEWDADADHYIPMEELRESKDDQWRAMVEGRWEDYGGERPEQFRSRIIPVLDAVIDAHPGETVVVVCHGGVINVHLAALLGLAQHLWFDPGYTSVSRVPRGTEWRAIARVPERDRALVRDPGGHRMNVDVSSDGPVRIITINRPEARNAVDGPTAAALANAFRDFDADDRLSVGVLTGAGGTFCAGADLKSFGTERANSVDDDGDGPMGPSRMMLSKPVLAAVEGFAVAGGLELAIWCDLRIAARDAVFGVFCRRWGVPLIDGGTVRLPRLIGHSHALDLILTGRGVEGEEALRMGLANRLTEPGEARAEAVALAHELAVLPQTCMRMDRRSSYEQWDLPLDAAIDNELARGRISMRAPDQAVGRFVAGEGRHGAGRS